MSVSKQEASPLMHGRVSAVRGTVVDVWFGSRLPPIDASLSCELENELPITAVVHADVGNSSVRAIAADSTRGLRRGATVTCRGLPLRIPVGQQLVGRSSRLRNFLTQPFFVAETFTGMKGRNVSPEETLDGVEAILDGRCDDVPEEKLLMIGKLQEVEGELPPVADRGDRGNESDKK